MARRALLALPCFTEEAAESAEITPLGGLTNRVFKVETPNGRFALRIPGAGAAEMIDRRIEEANARTAAAAGVAPEVLHFGDDGTMLTRFIDAGTPLSSEAFRARPGAIERAGTALRRLHDHAAAFRGSFDPLAFLDTYAAALRRGGALSGEERRIVEAARKVGEALAAHPAPPKPCHCDPTGPNLLDTGERVWLIDWEYSAMNDPAWDLAYLSMEGRFDAGQDRDLLSAYAGSGAPTRLAARMEIMKPLCEVLAALWSLIQHGDRSRDGDFQNYAERTFRSCAARMRAPRFAALVARLGA